MLGYRSKLALLLALATLPAAAQDYRGSVVPRNTTPRSAKAIDLFSFDFQSPTWGHEGPSYFEVKTPVKGREYLVEADVSGIDAVASLQFYLADEVGGSVQPLVLWKVNDSESDGDFMGFVTVPFHPFQVIVSGTDRHGTSFRRALPGVIRPVDSAQERPQLPPGIEASQAARMQSWMDEFHRRLKAGSADAERRHPDGLIALTRSSVLDMTYEPFHSSDGSPIGLRLRYRIRFAADALIAAVPSVSPRYSNRDWLGVVKMKPLQGNITPAPEFRGARSLADVIAHRGRASYRAGVTYSFTIDMVPDYVIQGVRSGQFCLYERKFERRLDRWAAVRASTAPVSYSLSIDDLDYDAEVPSFFSQRTFYESFVQGGATDCGPTGNNRF